MDDSQRHYENDDDDVATFKEAAADVDVDDLFANLSEEEDPFAQAAADAQRKFAKNKYVSVIQNVAPVPIGSTQRDPDADGGDTNKKTADGKDKKKPRPLRLNEGLLLDGEKGFPALIRDMKSFKPKGKGHEEADLNRLLSRYQFWTQRMHPKSQFRDTVERVEKFSRSRFMHSTMTGWRDEALGINHPQGDGNDNAQGADKVKGKGKEKEASKLDDDPLTGNGPESEPAPEPHSDAAAYASSSPGPPTRPPSSPGVTDEDDETFLREIEEDTEMGLPIPRPPRSNHLHHIEDESDDDWDAFNDIHDKNSRPMPQLIPPINNPILDDRSKGERTIADDDVDMDDEFDDLGMGAATMDALEEAERKMTEAANQPSASAPAIATAVSLDQVKRKLAEAEAVGPPSAPAPATSTVDDDDDMYV